MAGLEKQMADLSVAVDERIDMTEGRVTKEEKLTKTVEERVDQTEVRVAKLEDLLRSGASSVENQSIWEHINKIEKDFANFDVNPQKDASASTHPGADANNEVNKD